MALSSVLTAPQRLTFRHNRIFVRAVPGMAEQLIHGPYIEVPEGQYSVYWRVELTGQPGFLRQGRALLRLDVTSDYGKTLLQERTFTASDIKAAGGAVRIDFNIPKHGAQNVEFRAYSFGHIEFLLDVKREVHDAKGNIFFLDPDLFEASAAGDIGCSGMQFIRENLAEISLLQRRGARLAIDGNDVRACFGGIEVFLSNKEDFEIFEEVFFANTYGVEIFRGLSVVDIGMNRGFAALSFAALHQVVEVHAYEPFELPFSCAIRNFALNPGIRAKISPHKFGLSDMNFSRKVGYDPHHTKGTSIRGTASEHEVTIELREAAPVLRPIIESARARGLTFLLKLDCEGSEFPIFASLEKANLLEKIDIILMEWHKWWDASKTQRDLIEPLLAKGFLVLDRTRNHEKYSGFIIAVRLAQAPG